MKSVGVIIPAAGSGVRFGSPLPKQYQLLDGEPILLHSIRTALAVGGVVSVVVPLAAGDAWFAEMLSAHNLVDNRIHTLLGGTERQQSVAFALEDESLATVDVILVHDAVRPLATVQLFERIAEAAVEKGAAVPGLPIADTVKRVANSAVVETVDRSELWRIQTPQGFRADVIRSAYAAIGSTDWLGTDDASVVERTGHPIFCVDGESLNEKITEPMDLIRAESVLRVYSRPL